MSINYKEIIENLRNEDIKQLLYQLGAEEVIEKDNCFITNTICHNESGGSLKLYYYFDSHMFYCYTCCESMSIFKFLEQYYKTRNYEYDWYNDIYQTIINCSVRKNFNTYETINKINYRDRYRQKNVAQLPEYDKKVLDTFVKRYPIEWLNDNITPDTMDKFNILYSISQNKIIIPHYDIDNRLIGIRGRALNPWEVENIGKYLPVKIEQIIYKHKLSLNLYGLNQNRKNIENSGICYIFESEKSVLQCDSFSTPNCAVAICGSALNIYQIKLLMKTCHPKEIVLCFDQEELPHENKYFYKLWKIGAKYKKYCNFSFVYDRNNLLQLKDSPSDNGQEIFEKLIERRVHIK